jgi:LCP family protein required for cell wall assembly
VRAIIMVLLFALLASFGLLAYASLRMDRVRVSGLNMAGPQMNVLVVGTDSREGLSPEELQALGTEAVDGKRTDTIFLLSARGQRTAMLSFPRDLFVTRCDGTPGRINAAFTIGDGPTCLTQTVERLSGIPVTHYMEMNFVGFRDIVDGIGSVPVVLDAPLRDVAAGVDLPAGCSRLSGDEALGFVRARSVDSDLGRIERQQYFLQQVAREAASPSTVLNPVSLVQTTGAVGGALTVNATFGPISLLRLGFAGRGLATGSGLPSFTVPASPATIGGAAVLVPDDAAAEQVFSSFRDGTVFDDPPPAGEVGEAAGAGLGAPGRATLQVAALGLPRLLADAGDATDTADVGGAPATC